MLVADDVAVPLRLVVNDRALAPHTLEALKELLLAHPGDSEVFLRFGTQSVRLPPQFRVEHSSRLVSELRVLLGENAVDR